jgi:predicted kinase
MSLPSSASLFLFGPRGTGKSTWIGMRGPYVLKMRAMRTSTPYWSVADG